VKLVDLSPKWLVLPNAVDGVRFYVGVSFLCPHCEHTPCPTCGHQRGRRLAFYFFPPIDPDNLIGRYGPEWWPENGRGRKEHRRESGDTFDTLTISPSVGFEQIGHWHGTITNGLLNP